MKYLLFFGLITGSIIVNAQTSDIATPDPSKKTSTVEVSCGQCNFALPGKGCELAIRIDGQAYFVEGTDIDDYGDAHAHDGFCEAIKTAEVQGELKDGKFKVSYFKLMEKTTENDIEK